MNKHKKKFINKLKRQSKDKLIELFCDLWEENYHYKKEIEHLNSLVFSQMQTLKFALNHQKTKFEYQLVEEDDDEEAIPDIKKEDLKSYV